MEEMIERAQLASRLADGDGVEIAAMLRANWGAQGTAQAVDALESTARRLSWLAGACRLAAEHLKG